MTNSTQNIHLNYFALLREQRGADKESLKTQAQTPRDLYEELRTRYSFTLPSDKISVAINDQFCSLDHPLKEGDTVVFIPPVAGG
jgi:molybdopterin converting factor subunit 1